MQLSTRLLQKINRSGAKSKIKSTDFAGINDYVARRIINMARNLGIRKDVGMTGGIAKNVGVIKCIERALGLNLVEFPEDPQLIGAIGAALFAADKVKRLI